VLKIFISAWTRQILKLTKNLNMNTKVLSIELILFIFIMTVKSFSQINPATNDLIRLENSNKIINAQNNKSSLKKIIPNLCKNDVFWGINSTGTLTQFRILGSKILDDGIIDSGLQIKSLAVCNNLNTGSINPTFYGVNSSNNSILYSDSGSNWTNVAQTSSELFYNGGGNGNYLYFQNDGFNDYNGKIIKYDGTSFSTHYTLDSMYFSAADIAVDNDGNVWCLTSSVPAVSQFIDVISPLGQLIKRYNFNFSSNSIYGCFLLNNILYLGLGNYNPTYPNSLLPISFGLDSAYIGTPLPMQLVDGFDLASCNSGSPLTSNTLKNDENRITIYPNPFDQQTNITFIQEQKNTTIKITDIWGKEIKTINFSGKQLVIEKGEIKSGIYFVQIIANNKIIVTRKIIIE
jgi:hypothetical protein